MRSRMNRNKALAIRLRKAAGKKSGDISPVNHLNEIPTSATINGAPLSLSPCIVKPKQGQISMPMPHYLESEGPWRDLGYFLRQDLKKYEPKEKDYMDFFKFYLGTLEGKICARSIWLTYSHLNRCHQVKVAYLHDLSFNNIKERDKV